MLYKSKKEAKACGGLVAAYGYDKYFNVSNHEQLLKTIEEADIKEYFEYISSDSRVCMFFDIDVKDNTENTIELLKRLRNHVQERYSKYNIKWIVLEAHGECKQSYHVIARMTKPDNGIEVVFKNVRVLKEHVKEILKQTGIKAIDLMVYRDGLMRTIYSSKPGETRPFMRSESSDDFEDIETFVTYISENSEVLPEHIKLNYTEILKEMLETIELSKTYEDWMRIGFSVIDYCKEHEISNEDGLCLFKMYSKRNIEKYNEEHTENQWKDWFTRDYDGKPIKQWTLLHEFKSLAPRRYDELGFGDANQKILKELDILSNTKMKIHEIKHVEIAKKSNVSIEAIMLSEGLVPIHDYVMKSCKKVDLYSECDRVGYKVRCRNCEFEYPPGSIAIDKSIAPTVFNMVINKEDNINNKDTSQVARYLLDHCTLIYTEDNVWYLYNNKSGIYETKHDLEIMNQMEKIVIQISEEGNTEEWFNWINKVSYKENLLRELKIKCFQRVDMDSKEFLLGFENGVLDLQTGEFRKGKKDEYVTLVCGVPYYVGSDTTLAIEMLSGTFVSEEQREFALNKFALCLEGFNREQMITFNYGFSASNGKSYMMERLRNCMGQYGGTFNVALLTGKMARAGEANSTLVDFNKKRFMYCSEPEAGAKLNANFIKLLTGDKVKGRGLYSAKEIEMSPSWKLFVNCNVLPNFDVYDEGIARRIGIMEFCTKFCEMPRRKNERKLKKYTRDEERNIECGLMTILVERYFKLRENEYKYDEPRLFTSMRKMYINDNKDIIRDLLMDNFEKGGNKDYVKMVDIKNVLKNGGIKEKDVITIQKLVLDIFNDIEFRENSYMNNKKERNYFIGLKTK